MLTLPYCTNPVVVFNRGAIVNMIARGYYFKSSDDGSTTVRVNCNINALTYATDFPFRTFNRILSKFYINGRDGSEGIRIDQLERWFTHDQFGNIQYLYLIVPCNHCVLCQTRRVSEFSARIEMESATSNTRPIMVTLTYDNYHLPFERYFSSEVEDLQHNIVSLGSWQCHGSMASSKFNSYFSAKPTSNKYIYHGSTHDSVFYFTDSFAHRPTLDITDVQKFLKRLRMYWTLHDIHPTHYDDGTPCSSYSEYSSRYPFRYAIIGEYGKTGLRPHYHCVFWNLPYHLYSPIDDTGHLDNLKSDIVTCWQNGIYESTQCEFALDCGRYVGKYIGKDLGDNRRGTYQTSRLGGGLGAKYLDSLNLPANLTSIPLLTRNGEYKELSMGRYANNRLFPPLRSMIHPDLIRLNRFIINDLTDIQTALYRYGYNIPYSRLILHRISIHLPHRLGVSSSNSNKIRYSGNYQYVDTYPLTSMRVYEPTSSPDLTVTMLELQEDDINLLFLRESANLMASNIHRITDDWFTELYSSGYQQRTISLSDSEISAQLIRNNEHHLALSKLQSSVSFLGLKMLEDKQLRTLAAEENKLSL